MKLNDKIETKQIIVPGSGKKGIDIIHSYINLITTEEFDMTISEASHILGCSYQYFTKFIVSEILHIRINALAKTLFNIYQDNIFLDFDEFKKIEELMKMRILLNRNDFFRYIRETSATECKYFPILKNDFDLSNIELIENIITEKNLFNKANKIPQIKLSTLIKDITKDNISKNETYNVKFSENQYIPKKYYSLKELKEIFSINYDAGIYNMISRNGVNKIKMCNNSLVRYDLNDFKKEVICVITYQSYLEYLNSLPPGISFFEILEKEIIKKL